KGPLSSSSGSVFAAVPGVPRLPPGKKPPGPPPGPPPPQVLALYGIPTRRIYGADTESLIPGFDKDTGADLGRDMDSSSESYRDQDNVDDDKSDSDADSKEDRDEGGDGNQRMSSDRQDDERNREERDRGERQSGESLRSFDPSNKLLLSSSFFFVNELFGKSNSLAIVYYINECVHCV
ncbi:unnamed protein product, partial [Tetraodon nigroviridis]